MLRALILLFIVYLGIVAIVYIGQRFLMYFPGRNPGGMLADVQLDGMRHVDVVTEDGLTLAGWFAPPRRADGQVVVFFHGNAGHIGHRVYKAQQFMAAGYGVYLCEYRGYGGNPGKPSEDGLYKDARACLQWLKTNGYVSDQWVLYGESIGSGPAVQMALEFQPPRLVLEAGFTSAVDVARQAYFFLPVSFLMHDRYDNLLKLPTVRSALLVLHGAQDTVVPPDHARKLLAASRAVHKKILMFDSADHNNLYDYGAGAAIIAWLDEKGDAE